MPRLQVAVDVDAPITTVFAAMTDWPRQREWMLGTGVRMYDGSGASASGRGVGAELRAVTGIGGLGVVDTMRIIEWDPPRICRVRHTGSLIRGSAAFEVRERSGASTVVWTEHLDLPLGWLGGLGWPLLKPVATVGLWCSLRRFAAWAPTWTPSGSNEPSADRG